MKQNIDLTRIFLWGFVILCGIEVGAGLYEIRVIEPLIMHAPPESVWNFSELRNRYPEFAINPGFRFWKFTSPFILLLALGLLILAFKESNRKQRRPLLVVSGLVIACFVATAVYFAPTTGTIMDSKKLGLSASETINLVSNWTNLNRVRLAFYSFAWINALYLLVSRKG